MLTKGGVVLNDVHSRLNPTRVALIARPRDEADVCRAIEHARSRGLCVSIAGGRHAMGGQQFGKDTLHIDATTLTPSPRLDAERGLLEIGAGTDWTGIIAATHRLQQGEAKPWGIRQKQTGADSLTLGGSIAANAHGRGLTLGPIVEDIEELTLVTPDCRVVRCSRAENAELFSLVVGGYGLFGVVVRAALRLAPRRKLRRLVDIIDIDDAMSAVRRRIAEGCLYGDFQYSIDPSDPSFLRRGVFACYQPVDESTPVSDSSADLSEADWLGLLRLAHTDKREAFRRYASHYLDTHGRVYWSDTMQLSTYIPSYADFLNGSRPASIPESLMITELYTPPEQLNAFMDAARRVLRETGTEDIYGTIRAIRPDTTTFLPWARGERACIIFNLRVPHTPEGVARVADTARSLIDAAIAARGSFFLTYHRWARRDQLLTCYPELPAFIAAKRRYDPDALLASDWYTALLQAIGEAEPLP